MLLPQISAGDLLTSFHRDAPYLFLGAAFVALGIVSGAFSALQRKRDPLLLYLAIYAALYGVRMWTRTDLVALSFHDPWLYPRVRFGLNYLVPIPAILFFNAAGLFNKIGRFAGNFLVVISCILAVATFAVGPADWFDRVNSVIVIVAIITLVAQSAPGTSAAEDFIIVRPGLLILAFLVVCDNLRGVFRYPFPDLEPFGFAAFLGCLGYVAARRALFREQELSKIQEELEVARRIQSSILPASFPESPHFQVAARYLPMTSVAGDFYDYVIARPQQAGLLIADVSGHSVPAALIASMVKLAAASQRAHAADPALFLSHMNSTLMGNTQNQFVTAAYVHLDSVAGELRYSAAGHPPMLLLRKGEITKVEENGLMLAAFDFASYSTATHALENGDRILLYTDGAVEAANSTGEFFGIEGLCEMFRKTDGSTASQAANMIVSKIKAWSRSQDDDLTVLICDYAR
jgi:phosphoserine phosphatase RsbU/P